MSPEEWARLPESSRKAMRWLVQTLGEGFTGQIHFDALNGSVEEIRPTRTLRTRDLVDATGTAVVD
jgi:hypothetical protein